MKKPNPMQAEMVNHMRSLYDSANLMTFSAAWISRGTSMMEHSSAVKAWIEDGCPGLQGDTPEPRDPSTTDLALAGLDEVLHELTHLDQSHHLSFDAIRDVDSVRAKIAHIVIKLALDGRELGDE